MFDLEMIKEIGYCHGIENYARHLTGRAPGEPPPTLLDYLPPDALTIVDESHQTVPQIRGMYHGDRSRKEVLVAYGFRLPSALDNRPLNFEEWEQRVGQLLFVSATPGPYELRESGGVVVEQIIRPTGLLDPVIDVRPVQGQVDDLLAEIRDRAAQPRARAGHDADQADGRGPDAVLPGARRQGALPALRHRDARTHRDPARPAAGEFDVLVGINLLREGLDLPEVSLVAILDADKEGFLRSGGSLIQTVGPRGAQRARPGHHVRGQDDRLDAARDLRDRAAAGDPGGLQRGARHHAGVDRQEHRRGDVQRLRARLRHGRRSGRRGRDVPDPGELEAFIARLQEQMKAAAANLEFEKAATLRDRIKQLQTRELGLAGSRR